METKFYEPMVTNSFIKALWVMSAARGQSEDVKGGRRSPESVGG